MNASPRREAVGGAAASDPRRFEWAIEITGSPALLHHAVPECGLVHASHDGVNSWTIVASATSDEIAQILAHLGDSNPIAARFADESCR